LEAVAGTIPLLENEVGNASAPNGLDTAMSKTLVLKFMSA
jgi:hypothetical protein